MLLFDGIIAGDIVKAYNHETEKVTFAKVKRTFKSEWNRIVHLFFGDKRISCTPGHKFWLPEKGKYMAADSLMRGVKVLTLAVGLMSLDSVAYADTVYTAYNFEVEDHHNYFVGEDGVLVHNHCALPRANISDELFEQIFPASKYSADELASIRNKLGRDLMPNGSNSPPNAFFDYINLAPNDVVRAERVKAWKILDDAGYNSLKLNVTSLEKLIGLLSNPKLVSSGLSENVVSRLITANRGPGAAALDKLTKGLDDLVAANTKFEDIGKLLSDMEKGSGFAEGARWIQKYIVNNTSEFAGSSVKFEEVIKAGSGIRRVDVRVGSDFFEFKTVSPPLPPPNFTSQFIKDLEIPAVTDVKQLKWYFDGSKISEISKSDFLNAINSGNIKQTTIDKLVGQGGTKQQLMQKLSVEFDNIFYIKNVE